MPRTAVGVVHADRAARQLADGVGAASSEPVRVREHDHRLRVAGSLGHDALVDGDDDFGQIAEGCGRGEQRLRLGGVRKRLNAVEQCADVALCMVGFDRGRKGRGGIGG